MNQVSMRKESLMEYKAVIFDLDGTLYYQKPFRIRMAAFLLQHLVCHPTSWRELLIIRTYRKVRENWEQYEKEEQDSQDLDMRQYRYVAEQYKMPTERVKDIVHFYMLEAPLKLLLPYRDDRLTDIIRQLKVQEKEIIVYSDYPVKDKLQALQIEADACFTSADAEIGCMKPNPKGLETIRKVTGYDAQEMIMIGDRYEKDGLAAVSNDMDYVILDSNRKKREAMEEKLL